MNRKFIRPSSVLVGILLAGSMTAFPQSTSIDSALDPEQLRQDYAKNPGNADLLYKSKTLTVRGKVLGIGSDVSNIGIAGTVRFKSYVSDHGHQWSCDFDSDRVPDIATVRKEDFVVLSGQLVKFLNFQHCRLISDIAPDDMFKGMVFEKSGDVRAPVSVSAPTPEYPESARQKRIQGVCRLSAVVGADGNVQEVTVVGPLEPSLDEKAVETVRTWKFKPGTKYDVPVAVRINVAVTFQLTPPNRSK
jgi:TonB family protein